MRAGAILIATALSTTAVSIHAQERPRGEAPGTGALLARIDDRLVPMPLISMEVSLAISGPIVRGQLVQAFENPTDDAIDAEYVFPLPEGAAVDAFSLEIGDRRYIGKVEEKEEARRAYETAKLAGRKAGLVEQHRPNLFRTRVANILPHEKVIVRLETLDDAEWSAGSFSTVFPTTITQRYSPGVESSIESVLTRKPTRPVPVSIRATIDAGVPLASVESPSHGVTTSLAASSCDVRVGDGTVPADRDFVLRWRPQAAQAPLAGGLVEERPDGRYGLAMLIPPANDRTGGIPTQTVFVIDVSGSMEGPSLEQAKAALETALSRLRPDDTFTLIKFDNENESYADRVVPATPAAIERAKGWVSGLAAGNGTEILPALIRALDLSEQGDPSVLQRVILITDGAVDNEEQVIAETARRLGASRLHIVGIGYAPNRYLMKELARAGRGSFEAIGNIAEVQDKTIALLERTARAAITNVTFEWDGAAPLDANPDPVPDLYEGQPLVVTARFDPGKPLPRLRVWGRAPGGPVTINVEFTHVGRDSGIGTRWARARIAGLEQSRVHGADPAVVRADVIELAKRFSLVTSYTSFVVVADDTAGPNQASDSERESAVLPQGGTHEPLLLVLGVVLCGAGAVLLAAACRAGLATRMKRSRCAVAAVVLLAPGLLLLARAGWIEAKGELAKVLIDRTLEANLADGRSRPPWTWADMHPMARLTVPRLSVERPILSNASGPALAFGLGHVDGTAAPASPGNSVIAGHRDSWAAFLADLQTGDEVVVETSGRRAVYRVASTAIVRFDDAGVLDDEREQLTLVTCWPFRGWVHSPWRFVVRCAAPESMQNALHGEDS